ncbi:MAG TPA: hypothetical protein VF945_22290 [Polyangia bacterium]
MRAHVELTPAERKVLTTLTQEERKEVLAQMLASVSEELEWQLAVEQARAVAETVPAVIAQVAPPPVPPASPRPHVDARSQRYRWPSYPARAGAKR